MANTVNDVMNVIASPDYGIKSIAGTSYEILAILQGTHNSQNNIHTIVDDVRTLLQKLVETTSQKAKPIEVSDKSPKVNNKHIQSILDETKGIRKAIIDLGKALSKQSGQNVAVAKLSDKASEKIAEAMLKDIEKQKQGGGLSSIVDAFNKLKNISIKDLFIGKKKVKEIMKIFQNAKEELKVDDKDLNTISKLINSSPEMVKILAKIGRKVDKIIKNNTITKLGDILVGSTSILTIALLLQENKSVFEDANKVAKNIKELLSSINKAMRKLFFAFLWSKIASNGVTSIEKVVDKIIPLAKKLNKNKDNIKQGTKAARKITALIGNLLVTSIFLTMAAVVGIPAILGALALKVIVNIIIPIAKKLSKNNKHIGKSIISAIGITAFTGIMLITSLLLTSIAKTGIPAILGSLVVLGITIVNVFTFKILSKAAGTIIKGALIMAIMSISLIIFGIALQKITNATKGVSFKQVGVIAAITLVLGAAVAVLGIPALFPFIILGSISMAIMGFALMPFAETLGKITKATKNLKMKQIMLVAGSMLTLAGGIAALAILLVPVLLGSVTLMAMMIPLSSFVRSLKIISDMKTVPTAKLNQVLNAMKTVGNFFKKNGVSLKAIWNAAKYMLIMPPFTSAVRSLAKLKKLGVIPMKLVYGALSSIRAVGNFFKNNKVKLKAIWNAAKYRVIMVPFTGAVKSLSKLKKLGVIPMKLVYGALNAIRAIANYYENNPISKKAIKASWRYTSILWPFGYSIRQLYKLKKLGVIPMKLVYGALNAIRSIANYYEENPITKKAIKAAYRYTDILWPFGYAIRQLFHLKKLGSLPMRLVNQTLDAIGSIADFYLGVKVGFKDGIKAMIGSAMITGIVKSFSKAVGVMKDLKDLKNIPTESINNIIYSISAIVWYYRTVKFGKHIKLKSLITEYIIDRFTDMAMKVQEKLEKIKSVDYNAIKSIVLACSYIIKYYRKTKFWVTKRKINRMNSAIIRFVKTAQYLNEINFKKSSYISVKYAVKSMKRIIRFLKYNSFNRIQRKRAYRTIGILNSMAAAMANLSNINPANLSSIGNALTDTLSGVSTIDMSQVKAVTNMFRAFNGINKSEHIINKFTQSVKEFTTACNNLMDAMSHNTDAINNMDTSSKSEESSGSSLKDKIFNFIGLGTDETTNETPNNTTDGIKIANIDELAKAIAEKINGVLSVDMPDTQVQLLINGTGGNEWTISRY